MYFCLVIIKCTGPVAVLVLQTWEEIGTFCSLLSTIVVNMERLLNVSPPKPMKPNPLMGRSTYWVAPVFTFKAQNFMSHADFLFLFVHISNQMYDFVIEKEKYNSKQI